MRLHGQLEQVGIEQKVLDQGRSQATPKTATLFGTRNHNQRILLRQPRAKLVDLGALLKLKVGEAAEQFVLIIHSLMNVAIKPKFEGENLLLVNHDRWHNLYLLSKRFKEAMI